MSPAVQILIIVFGPLFAVLLFLWARDGMSQADATERHGHDQHQIGQAGNALVLGLEAPGHVAATDDQARDELLYSNVKGKNPLKDKRVRQALYQAIDIEGIRMVINAGILRLVLIAILVGAGAIFDAISAFLKSKSSASKGDSDAAGMFRIQAVFQGLGAFSLTASAFIRWRRARCWRSGRVAPAAAASGISRSARSTASNSLKTFVPRSFTALLPV